MNFAYGCFYKTPTKALTAILPKPPDSEMVSTATNQNDKQLQLFLEQYKEQNNKAYSQLRGTKYKINNLKPGHIDAYKKILKKYGWKLYKDQEYKNDGIKVKQLSLSHKEKATALIMIPLNKQETVDVLLFTN